MPRPAPKFDVGTRLRIIIGECTSQVKVGARTYHDIKDTWTYYISGNGDCGKWSEWVNETFLTEHMVDYK